MSAARRRSTSSAGRTPITLHRFFLPASAFAGSAVTFDALTTRQLRDVLRLAPGDHVIVLDDSGWEYTVQLETVDRQSATGSVRGKKLASGEPRTKIVLFQGLLKGSKFEYVLQKCTEVGVAAFVPITTARAIVPAESAADRYARWSRIIQEAAEQARRGRLPRLHPVVDFKSALSQAAGLTLIPWEGEERRSIRAALAGRKVFAVNLFIGPEGGFREDEIALALEHGAIPVSLGPRILRAETAGVVAASVILYELGDLGG
ncbi:MAG: RsmE family RNA methyltransferase [Chloroflexota bacterium]|nr:RsmE family RNA methyltransferase [Chloroflexota bacterium]